GGNDDANPWARSPRPAREPGALRLDLCGHLRGDRPSGDRGGVRRRGVRAIREPRFREKGRAPAGAHHRPVAEAGRAFAEWVGEENAGAPRNDQGRLVLLLFSEEPPLQNAAGPQLERAAREIPAVRAGDLRRAESLGAAREGETLERSVLQSRFRHHGARMQRGLLWPWTREKRGRNALGFRRLRQRTV